MQRSEAMGSWNGSGGNGPDCSTTDANYSTLNVCHEEIAKMNTSPCLYENRIVIDFLRSAVEGVGEFRERPYTVIQRMDHWFSCVLSDAQP